MTRAALVLTSLGLLLATTGCGVKKCTSNAECAQVFGSLSTCHTGTGLCDGAGAGGGAAIDRPIPEQPSGALGPDGGSGGTIAPRGECAGLRLAMDDFFGGRSSCDFVIPARPTMPTPLPTSLSYYVNTEAQCSSVLPSCSTTERREIDGLAACLMNSLPCAPGQENAAGEAFVRCLILTSLSANCRPAVLSCLEQSSCNL